MSVPLSWLAVMAALTSSCNCGSGIEFEITLTCTEVANGVYNSEFSQKLSSELSRLFNLMLVLDQATGICDPDPFVNIVFSLRDVSLEKVIRHESPRTWWGALNECSGSGGQLAHSDALRAWTWKVFNLTYVDDGRNPSKGFGKDCSALSKSDWKIVEVDCAAKLPFLCVF